MNAIKFFERAIGIVSGAMSYILALAAIGLLLWIYQREGFGGLLEAVTIQIKNVAIKYAWIVFMFIVIAGAIDHLAKKNPEDVKDLISGKRGEAPMIIVSTILPGPAGANQLREEWESGENRGNVIVCLTAMMALSITMFIFRARFLGGQLTLIWVGIAGVMLFQVWFVCKLKPWEWFKT